MRSSSIHQLNADHHFGKWFRRFWYFLNWLNNGIFPNFRSSSLLIKQFQPKFSKAEWESLPPKQSPSRAYSDLFWMKLPWKSIQSRLENIHVLDSGSGAGNYAPRLIEYSNSRIGTYKGVDVFDSSNWKKLESLHSNVEFAKLNSKKILSEIPAQTNLFISQSAIEHFEEDLTFFRGIRTFVQANQRPTIQIHLFPSSICLKLYRGHGVRQYTPRTVSKIHALFEEFSSSELYKLGGARSNQLHWDFITKPIFLDKSNDRRESESPRYMQKLKQVIDSESISGDMDQPSFYALVIQSYVDRSITINS
jgi:hypothetical protein